MTAISCSTQRLLAITLLLLSLFLSGCISSTTNPDVVHDEPLPEGVETNTETIEGEEGNETVEEEEEDSLTFGIKSISAGQNHNCAIKNNGGELWCWGENERSELGNNGTSDSSTPYQTSEARWRSVSSGSNHNCAISQSKHLFCWGDDSSRQLGIPTVGTQETPPYIVDLNLSWQAVAAGENHTCGIQEDHTLWCWGDNQSHQLGITGANQADRPFSVDAESDWQAISAGIHFNCGLRAINEGELYLFCWGKNDTGQTGTGGAGADVNTPQQVGTANNWRSVHAGGNHACAVDETDTLYCWGDNGFGQLGQNNNSDQSSPTQVADAGQWQMATAGENHSCGIQTDGTLWCWGNNEAGQLGQGHTQHQAIISQVEHSTTWRWVTAGASHTCAIDADYLPYCWGLNLQGQLGTGAPLKVNSTLAIQYELSDNWISVDSGHAHTCGLKQTFGDPTLKTLWCGGLNHYGQLGIHSIANMDEPQQISGPDQTLEYWREISLGQYTSCAISFDQALYCWGNNNLGQLGHANASNVIANWGPNTKISIGGDNWLKIRSGAVHTCGIKNTDELWCWGDNSRGQSTGSVTVGADTAEPPTRIAGAWKDVAVGGYIDLLGDDDTPVHAKGGHTCAIDTSNQLHCWGENNYSQLGNGATNTQTDPSILVNSDTDWSSVVAGNSHSCAIKTDQSLFCWGRFERGATGTANTPALVPTQIADDNNTWLEVFAGEIHTCAIDTDNKIWCWGSNREGQLTSNVTNLDANGYAFTPSRSDLSIIPWQTMGLGGKHSCGIREAEPGSRKLYCWGESPQIQLGDGSSWEALPLRVSLE